MANGSGLFRNQYAKKPHLLQASGGIAAEVKDLRDDIASSLGGLAAITVDEYTNAPAADTDAFKTAIATVAAVVTYSGTALNGVVGEAALAYPRNVTVTTGGATPADAPATATINGVDVNGSAISETITVAQTAATAAGTKAFSKVTSIELPAADGTAATLEFGFGDLLGLSQPIKTRAGYTGSILEIEAGTATTTGAFADTTVGAPNGTYLPTTVPDGSTDYAVYYEYDPTA